MTKSTPEIGASTRRIETVDPRSDDRRRVVWLAPDRIVIARSLEGVSMRLVLETRAYAGVLLRLAGLDPQGFHYEIRLAHADSELSIPLAELRDETIAEAEWSEWARFLGLPKVVERAEGVWEPERPMIGGVVALGPMVRRRGRALFRRRARFLTRRKVGRPELCVGIGASRELFGGWRPDI